jgi:hypothetical protein
MLSKVAVVVLALAAALLTPDVPAQAAESPPIRDHCVVHVTGQKASGELTLSPPRCYSTHSRAMQAEGVTAWGRDAAQVASADFQIGYHCDGYDLAPPCTSVVGSSCIGGWLNVSAAWNNRISSTLSGCPIIRHFDLANLGGSFWATSGAGPHNLTAFNNRTTSIQYT